MSLIDLTIEDEDAIGTAKEMLSGVDIEGAQRVRLVVEDMQNVNGDAPDIIDVGEDESEEPEEVAATPDGDSGN